jgi:hypothetical protein
MYEMQGPRPVQLRWLTDCSAARRYLADHCHQIPARSAGRPTLQPFSGVSPGIGIRYQIPVRNAGHPTLQPFPSFPRLISVQIPA